MIYVLCLLVAVINIDTAIAFQSSFAGTRISNTKHTPTFVSRSSSSSKSTLYMKTIAVFGSSGLTASECIYQAIQNGDTVVGLTR